MYREPTAWEHAIFKRLLSEPFPARETIASQLKSPSVRLIDENGSLEFKVQDVDMGHGREIPVEAEVPDEDGMMIRFLLHTIDGNIVELEVYKDDSSPVLRMPDAGSLSVMSPRSGPGCG
jgi:hypothetical protein